MRKYITKVSAIVIILLTLSSLAVADRPSLPARLINWLRSNFSVFSLKGQGEKGQEHRAEQHQKEQRSKGAEEQGSKDAPRHLRTSPPLSESSVPSLKSYGRSTQTAKLLRFYNYPNPFIPELGTDFICELDGEATFELKIFGVDGLLVRKLNWRSSESPPHWNGEDTIGRTVRTGMYIYVLKATDVITGEVADIRYGKMMAWYMD